MDKNKSQNWNFSFDAMPILFHSQTNQFMKYLDQDGQKFLQFWWNHVGDKLPEDKRLTPNGLTFEIEEIDKKTRLVIITLPSPREDGDAYFIGGIARPEKRFAMVKLPTSRMFVLFRDDHVDQPHRTNFGELTPQAHCRPRGIGLNPTKQDFKRIVKQKITARKKGLFK